MIDIEFEITNAIKCIGGERVSDHVGKSPNFDNADFIFPSYKIIAELKCLDENKIADKRFIEKASLIYKQELKNGTAPVFVSGEAEMSTCGFSEECARKIRNLYRKPIKKSFEKANKQIKNTRKNLKVGEYKGVVIVVNNNNTALDPWHIHDILKSIMNQKYYSGINGTLFFNVNQKTILPEEGREYTAFVALDRNDYQKVSQDFYIAFRDCWINHYSKLINEPTYTVSKANLNDLAKLENRKA